MDTSSNTPHTFPNTTALHDACRNNNLEAAKLVVTPENINQRTNDIAKSTPLLLACNTKEDTSELIKFLIENGADPEYTDTHGFAPLHYACKHHNLEAAKLVATPDIINKASTDAFNSTPLHWACKTKEDTSKLIDFLMKNGADPKLVDKSGYTPLYYACRHRNLQAAKLVVTPDNIKQTPTYTFNYTPLHLACNTKEDTSKLIDFLMKNGADPNLPDKYGFTPLRYACKHHNLQAAKLVVTSVIINKPSTSNKTTPLHLACNTKEDTSELITFLIENDADPLLTDIDGKTPLYYACRHKNLPAVKSVATPGSIKLTSTYTKTYNNYYYNYYTPLHLACNTKEDTSELIKLLLENGADPTITDNYEGFTPLLYACASNNLQAAKLVTPPGNIKQTPTYTFNYTPLHLACNTKEDTSKLIEFLMENGADPLLIDEYEGFTPLHYASKNNNLKAAILVTTPDNINKAAREVTTPGNINKAAKSTFASFKCTPLHLACHTNQDTSKLIEFLMENGADPLIIDEYGGFTPLHYACIHNNFQAAKLVVTPSNTNKPSSIKTTPLHLACHTNQDTSKLINFLMENGADPLLIDEYGYTPLHYACKHNNLQAAKLVTTHDIINTPSTSSKTTPLHLACDTKEDTSELITFLMENENGADPKLVDNIGYTPLHYACKHNNLQAAKLVTESDNINKPSTDTKNTPLHLACITKEDTSELIKFLMENGADPKLANANGYIPLHYACNHNNLQAAKLVTTPDIINTPSTSSKTTPLHLACNTKEDTSDLIEFLMENGADPLLADKIGYTPLHYACKHNNLKAAKLVTSSGNISKPTTGIKKKFTPLQVLCESTLSGPYDSIYDLAIFLLSQGANPLINLSGNSKLYAFNHNPETNRLIETVSNFYEATSPTPCFITLGHPTHGKTSLSEVLKSEFPVDIQSRVKSFLGPRLPPIKERTYGMDIHTFSLQNQICKIIDLGGHKDPLHVHPIFIDGDVTYFVVFDLRIIVNDPRPHLQVIHWFNEILQITKVNHKPLVYLVGTHLDSFHNELKSLASELKKNLTIFLEQLRSHYSIKFSDLKYFSVALTKHKPPNGNWDILDITDDYKSFIKTLTPKKPIIDSLEFNSLPTLIKLLPKISSTLKSLVSEKVKVLDISLISQNLELDADGQQILRQYLTISHNLKELYFHKETGIIITGLPWFCKLIMFQFHVISHSSNNGILDLTTTTSLGDLNQNYLDLFNKKNPHSREHDPGSDVRKSFNTFWNPPDRTILKKFQTFLLKTFQNHKMCIQPDVTKEIYIFPKCLPHDFTKFWIFKPKQTFFQQNATSSKIDQVSEAVTDLEWASLIHTCSEPSLKPKYSQNAIQVQSTDYTYHLFVRQPSGITILTECILSDHCKEVASAFVSDIHNKIFQNKIFQIGDWNTSQSNNTTEDPLPRWSRFPFKYPIVPIASYLTEYPQYFDSEHLQDLIFLPDYIHDIPSSFASDTIFLPSSLSKDTKSRSISFDWTFGGFDYQRGLNKDFNEFALPLLKSLVDIHVGKKPAIFICHGFGGILFKLLVHLSNTSITEYPSHIYSVEFKKLLSNIKGVIYFDTPHVINKTVSTKETVSVLSHKMDAKEFPTSGLSKFLKFLITNPNFLTTTESFNPHILNFYSNAKPCFSESQSTRLGSFNDFPISLPHSKITHLPRYEYIRTLNFIKNPFTPPLQTETIQSHSCYVPNCQQTHSNIINCPNCKENVHNTSPCSVETHIGHFLSPPLPEATRVCSTCSSALPQQILSQFEKSTIETETTLSKQLQTIFDLVVTHIPSSELTLESISQYADALAAFSSDPSLVSTFLHKLKDILRNTPLTGFKLSQVTATKSLLDPFADTTLRQAFNENNEIVEILFKKIFHKIKVLELTSFDVLDNLIHLSSKVISLQFNQIAFFKSISSLNESVVLLKRATSSDLVTLELLIQRKSAILPQLYLFHSTLLNKLVSFFYAIKVLASGKVARTTRIGIKLMGFIPLVGSYLKNGLSFVISKKNSSKLAPITLLTQDPRTLSRWIAAKIALTLESQLSLLHMVNKPINTTTRLENPGFGEKIEQWTEKMADKFLKISQTISTQLQPAAVLADFVFHRISIIVSSSSILKDMLPASTLNTWTELSQGVMTSSSLESDIDPNTTSTSTSSSSSTPPLRTSSEFDRDLATGIVDATFSLFTYLEDNETQIPALDPLLYLECFSTLQLDKARCPNLITRLHQRESPGLQNLIPFTPKVNTPKFIAKIVSKSTPKMRNVIQSLIPKPVSTAVSTAISTEISALETRLKSNWTVTGILDKTGLTLRQPQPQQDGSPVSKSYYSYGFTGCDHTIYGFRESTIQEMEIRKIQHINLPTTKPSLT